MPPPTCRRASRRLPHTSPTQEQPCVDKSVSDTDGSEGYDEKGPQSPENRLYSQTNRGLGLPERLLMASCGSRHSALRPVRLFGSSTRSTVTSTATTVGPERRVSSCVTVVRTSPAVSASGWGQATAIWTPTLACRPLTWLVARGSWRPASRSSVEPAGTTPSTKVAACAASLSMTRSATVSVPRSTGSTWPGSATPTSEERPEVEFAVVVSADGVTDDAEHQGDEESDESACGCGNAQQ